MKNKHQRDIDSSGSERSIDSSGSERSIDSLSSVSSKISNTSENKPAMAYVLPRQLLGQHAGELLLDFHKFGKKNGDQTVYTMPGLIIKDTEVSTNH